MVVWVSEIDEASDAVFVLISFTELCSVLTAAVLSLNAAAWASAACCALAAAACASVACC